MKNETPLGTGQSSIAIIGPPKCDKKGNVYLRSDQVLDWLAAPVVKLSSEGKQVAVFGLGSIPDVKNGESEDFAIGLRDEFYLLATICESETKCSSVIAAFRQDGVRDSILQLSSELLAVQGGRLAVFPSGESLVTGWKEKAAQSPQESDAPTKHLLEPYTAIYDRRGRTLTEVHLPSDIEFKMEEDAAGGGTDITAEARAVLALGAVTSGDDGCVYLMHPGIKPVIYGITSAGAVLRRFVAVAPSEGDYAVGMAYAGPNRLLVRFAQKRDERSYATGAEPYSVVDAEGGERLFDYQSTRETGGIFVCYVPDTFTFLATTRDGRIGIRRSGPR